MVSIPMFYHRLPVTYITHHRSLLGISESADVEDLKDDGWNNIPANDQVVHADPPPASINSGNLSRNQERARGGARGGCSEEYSEGCPRGSGSTS